MKRFSDILADTKRCRVERQDCRALGSHVTEDGDCVETVFQEFCKLGYFSFLSEARMEVFTTYNDRTHDRR
jgi:hypothetical protein